MLSSTSSSNSTPDDIVGPMRWFVRRIPFVIALCLTTVVFGELAMRLFMLSDLRYLDHPVLGHTVKPNQTCCMWLGNFAYPTPPILINSDGHRGAETNWTQDTCVAIGSSQVFAPGVLESETWCSQLESQLHAETRSDIEVVNAGQPGYGPFQQMEFLKQILEQHTNVRVAIVRVGLGDRNFGRPTAPGRWSAMRKKMREYTEFVPFLYNKLQAQGTSLRRAGIPWCMRTQSTGNDESQVERARRMWDSNKDYWTAMAATTASTHCQLVFLIENPTNDPGESWLAQQLATISDSQDHVNVVELQASSYELGDESEDARKRLYRERFTLGYDPHHNALCHQYTARALYRYFADHGILATTR